MAKKMQCHYIVSNDRRFFSADIPLLSSEAALDRLNQN